MQLLATVYPALVADLVVDGQRAVGMFVAREHRGSEVRGSVCHDECFLQLGIPVFRLQPPLLSKEEYCTRSRTYPAGTVRRSISLLYR